MAFDNKPELVSNFHLSNIVKDLVESITNFELIHDKLEQDTEKFFFSHITGAMVLKGINNVAILVITIAKHPASMLVSKISGIEFDNITQEDIQDGIMELTNMIAGKVKTKAAADGIQIELTAPVAFIGKGHYSVTKEKTEVIDFRLRDKDFQIIVKLIYV